MKKTLILLLSLFATTMAYSQQEILTLKSASGTGNSANPFVIFKDANDAQIGSVGYVSPGNSLLYLNNLLSDGLFVNGKMGIGGGVPSRRLSLYGTEGSNPSLLIQNSSYSSTNSIGTVSMQFGFANHVGPKIEAYKLTNNITGLKLYTEYGYNANQLAMTFKPGIDGTNVGIGTTDPSEKLEVSGNARIVGDIYSKKIKVSTNAGSWPDYVFEKDYDLSPLSEVEAFVNTNKHLPEVPAAKEVETHGQDLGEMQATLLKKVEELTLYTIAQDKDLRDKTNEIQALKNENKVMMGLLVELQEQINQLKKEE